MNEAPESLFRQLVAQSEDKLPPVHLWHPSNTTDIGMRISRDGTWWYQGTPISRRRMVRLFSRVLRREGEEYFLVTPVEKVRVEVEVAPLVAVQMEVRSGGRGPEIAFRSNVDDIVVVDRDHPILMHGTPEAPLPVVVVRDRIEALIARSVYYELVEQGETRVSRGREVLIVHSCGIDFELGAL